VSTAIADPGSTIFEKVPRVKEASRPGFLSNLTAVLGGQLSCAIVALLVQACYARLLGPAGRGQISLCLMVTAFGVLVGGLGGDYALTIWTAESREKSAEWLPAISWTAILGSFLASCLWFLVYWKWSPSFLKGMTSPMAVVVLVSIPLSILFTYMMAILTGLEWFRLRSGLALSNQIAGLLGIALLVSLFGAKPEIALVGYQLGLLACALVTAGFLRDFLRSARGMRVSTRRVYSVLNLGLRGQLGNLATFFNYRLDVFIVNYFFDTTQVGLYAVGVLVAEGLWQIPHAAALALFPRTARTVNQGAAQFTCLVIRQVLLVACVSGATMALLSPWIIPLVFGARFAPSVPVIWWILPGTIALSVSKVICADLAGRGRPEFSSICAFLSLAVTISLDLLLIPRMGINGAALASTVAYSVQTVLLAIFLKRHLQVPWKFILVPSFEEFAVYRLVWLLFKARLWPDAAPLLPPGSH
jgi:O-antigen/teichoic acid export membrane protein